MKRLFTLILAVILCLSITSCGSAPKEEQTTTASTTAETTGKTSEIDNEALYSTLTLYSYKTAEEIQEEYPNKTVLTWVGFALTADSSLEIEIPIDEINEYLDSIGKDYVLCFQPLNMTEAIIRYDNGDYSSMLDCFTDYIESGGQADILTIMPISDDEPLITAYYYNALNGIYEPLETYFDSSEEASEYYNSLPEEYWESFKVNGTLYSFGGFNLGVRRTATNYYLINTDLADKYGWDYEKSLFEQLDLVEAIMSEENCRGIKVNYSSLYKEFVFAGIIGTSYDDGIVSLQGSTSFSESLSLWYELKDSGLIFDDAEDYTGMYLASYGVSTSTYSLDLGKSFTGEQTQLKTGDDTYSDFTTVADNTSFTYTSSSAGGVSIYSASEHKSEAFDFTLLTQTDSTLNNLLSFGNSEEGPYLINYRFANPLITDSYGDMPENMNELFSEILENAQPAYASEAVGFAFDVRGYEELYSAVQDVVKNHSYLYYSSVENDLSALQSELEEAGINELLEEVNSQYLSQHPYKTVSETKAEYPDKTVLVWLGYDYPAEDTRLIPIDTINDYLVSLGKDYVICFSPVDFYNATLYYDDARDAYIEQLESSEQVDILTRCSLTVGNGLIHAYYSNIYDGIYKPLDSYFESSEEAMAYYNSLPEEYWDSFRVNGTLYNFGGYEVGVRADCYYYINTELAEKYGWDFDKTITEQLDIIKEVMQTEGCAGVSAGYSSAYLIDRFIYMDGISFDSEYGVAVSLADSEKLEAYLEMMYELKNAGVLENYDIVGLDDCFIYVNPLRFEIRSHIQKIVDSSDSTEDYTVVPMSDYHYTQALGGIGIYSGSEYKSQAFDFILLSQTDSYLNNLLTYGIEGEDYNIVDGVVSDARPVLNMFRFYNPLISLPYSDSSGDMPEDMNELCKEILETASPADESEAIGFAFDVRGYEELNAAVERAAWNHSYVGYSSVEEDLATLKSELEEAGIDELLEEINRQYSEWRANNYD
ncbi:MAG: ABC transporter substrate-binding protein [Ruminococcus sp.]|nr:ABC transporter substrate-binding protein [Ruminococcus sp.]